MAEDDMIAAYVAELRHALRWHRDSDEIVLEVEDHLRESASRHGVSEADALVAYGSVDEVARTWATSPQGGLAVPTRLTRWAGLAGYIGGGLWLASVVGAFYQGDFGGSWSQQRYEVWVSVTGLAALCVTLLFAGCMIRSGGRRDPLTVAAIGLAGLSTLGVFVAGWFWPLMMLPMGLAALVAVLRLARTQFGMSWASRLTLPLLWPVAGAIALAGDALRIGPLDEYGDAYILITITFVVAAAGFAVVVARLGARLFNEVPVEFSAGTPARA